MQASSFAGTSLDVSGLPTRHPYTLALWQNHSERILLAWVEDLGVPIRRDAEVTGFTQDATGVHVSGDEPVRAAYLVGADGGRSVVRRAAGIDFVGADATRSNLIAEVEVTEEIPKGVRYDDIGVHGLGLMEKRSHRPGRRHGAGDRAGYRSDAGRPAGAAGRGRRAPRWPRWRPASTWRMTRGPATRCSAAACPTWTSPAGRTGCNTSAPAAPAPGELPVLGDVPAPTAVLVRPDGHVAWVGDGSDAGLKEALGRWFGPNVVDTIGTAEPGYGPRMDIDDVGPDRNRLHDLVKLTWDQAGGETITDEQVAAAGPYSVEQIREHLQGMKGDLYEVDDDGGSLRVTSVR